MFGRILTGLLMIGGAIMSTPAAALENTSQVNENKEKICSVQTQLQERKRGIPAHLLTAISLVESGRWTPSRKANSAWPWTVTSGGEGRFFDSKAEAMAEVEILMTEGVQNIDVGCMQINMRYHADAFETLSDAFDPAQNAAYAAKFLSKLKTPSNSWIDAAGTYHSSTLDKKTYYQGKVVKAWNTERGLTSVVAATLPPASKPVQMPIQQIDYARMNRLNSAFKKRQSADPVASNEINKTKALTARRQNEMREWQDARARGVNMTELLAMRRAQQKLRQRKRLASMGKSKFPERRQSQLQKWRQKGIWYGG